MNGNTESQITSGKAKSIDTPKFRELLRCAATWLSSKCEDAENSRKALIAHIEAVREKDIKELKHALWCAEVNLVSRHEHNAELTKRAEKAEAELKAIAERQAAGLPEDGVVYEADDGTVCKKRHGELIWHAHIYTNNESLDDVAVAQEVAAALTALSPAQQEPANVLTLENAPIGTKAPAINGGHWERVEHGWKWCTGSTFPRPGGDWTGELIAPEAASATDADRPCECFGGQARCKAPSPCPAQATPEGGQAKKHEEAVTNILGSADGAVKADQTGIYK